MNGEYQIFKRDPVTGLKSQLVQRYKSFTLTLNWGQQSKFNIKGETIGNCELETGDYILFYRNLELVFSGVVTEVNLNCDSPSDGKIEWTATGEDDTIIFKNRISVPDPDNMTFFDKVVDKSEGYAYNRLIHYLRMNMGSPLFPPESPDYHDYTINPHAASDRQIEGLAFPFNRSIGLEDLSQYRYKTLSDIIKDIGGEVDEETGDENGLYPIFEWNPDTGLKSIKIPEKRDMTDKVTLNPQFGNVTAWGKTTKYPKYNALWICSGSYTDKDAEVDEETGKKPTTRIWQYHTDEESIAKFGRIEKLVTKSDIKVVYDDEKTEDEDETVTEEEVNRLLTKEANKLLRENASQTKYTITMAETPELQFWTDWKCGDLVTCIINGEKFTSTIKTVSINYAKGKETVKPTVGGVEHGEFADIFKTISGIDTRLEDKEMEMES